MSKLSELRSLDSYYRVFGAQGHKYHLLPTLAESQVVGVERQFALSIPGDYRAFLLHAGAGGAGPAYGLVPFTSAIAEVDLNRPFLWTREVYEGRDFDYDRDWDVPPGVARVCHHGCGFETVLVLRGACPGMMWFDNTPTEGNLVPLECTFSQWYENWLDRSIERMRREPVVDRIQVGMNRIDVERILGSDYTESDARKGDERYLQYRNAAVTVVVSADVVVRVIRHSV